jgi:formylglycine-generating enzyme
MALEPNMETAPELVRADAWGPRRSAQANVSSLKAVQHTKLSQLEGDLQSVPNGVQAAPLEIPDPDPEIASTPPPLASDGSETCPHGMVLIEGEYCPSVAHRCLDYLSVERDRCAEYAEGHRCFGKPVTMRFCIDRFEYPNVSGIKPMVAVSYRAAEQKCVEQGKRLCTANEWTLACEGPERLPYPTGRRRDENTCNYDKAYRFPDNNAYANPRTREAEIKRLDQRVASGEMAECVSAYGVHDMTGNVDEWVFNQQGAAGTRPYLSGLKGGYWGPVRNRCRPMTVDHNEWHSGYQIGFRCCAEEQDQSSDAEAGPGAEEPLADVYGEESQVSG